MVREITSNLSLIKPDALDQYNINDFNSNFQAIDDFAGLTPPKALTADKLTTGAKINGVLFDGTQDVTLPPTGADTDLSNLTSTGEKHFVNKTQLTNCILEIPQNIKYTLEDGVLTIKAGTIVTVPYGTTDQSATYPVGATFLNNNFKVVKTYFTNNKFFVQAEVQADIVSSGGGEPDGHGRTAIINLTSSTADDFLTDRQVSGDNPTVTQNYSGVYNTTTNRVGKNLNNLTINYTNVRSFPLLQLVETETERYGNVKQVFNGMGYIGSTYWVDGITVLLANGLNADGTKNNTQFVPSMAMFTVSAGSITNNAIIIDSANGMVDSSIAYRPDLGFGEYDSSVSFTIRGDNYIVTVNSASAQPKRAVIGRISYVDNLITDFAPFSTISVADDGNVLHKYGNETAYGDKTLANDLTVEGTINIQNDIVMTKTENAYGSLLYYNKAADYTALTPYTQGARILTLDKNNQYFGYYQVVTDPNTNALRSLIGARRVVNGAEKSGSITLEIDASGNVYGIAPTYTTNYADSSSRIVTTAYMANHWVTGRATTASSASKARPAVVIQNYVSGTSWYRVWSDGWIEQGGRVQLTSQNTTGTVVSFLKAFQNTNYSVNAMVERYTSSAVSYTDDSTVLIQGLATNNMTLILWDANNNSYKAYVRWRACGY